MEDGKDLKRELFGENFSWGVSAAAFQTEGNCDADGKGASIWDEFTKLKGSVIDGHNARIACDNYNRYQEDIALIKALGIPCYRFSISWPRIIPDGYGTVNQAGIDHYNKVINCCLENGIEPWITLYHWDLPHQLELKGGWVNREIVDWFAAYVAVCIKNFGDRVKNWMVMNEPMVFTGAGYFLGVHAPGKTGLKYFLPAVHHVILAIAEGARTIRDLDQTLKIGTTFSCSLIEPRSNSAVNVAAANKVDALINRLFIEPLTGLGYPFETLGFLRKIKKYMLPGDDQKMQFDWDFIGIQNYTREIVQRSFFTPYLHAKLVKAKDRGVPLTAMGWEVYPAAMYEMLKKFNRYIPKGKIIITENGAAFPDHFVNGSVDDPQRIAYLEANIAQVLRAKQEGLPVEGYFIWTLTDNFEWSEGYHPRFGIVHVDFETQKRTIKASGHWYRSFLNDTK